MVLRQGTNEKAGEEEALKKSKESTLQLAQTFAAATRIGQVERILKNEGCENIKIIPQRLFCLSCQISSLLTYLLNNFKSCKPLISIAASIA